MSPDQDDRLRAELAVLGAPPMPDDVTARIGAALAEEMPSEPPGPRVLRGPRGHAGTTHRRRRPPHPATGRGRPAVLAGLVAAVVVVVAAVAVTVGAPAAPRVAGEESDLRAAGAGAFGARDAGALTDPERRRSCLTAAGVPGAGAPLLGGRPYVVRGETGTLLVLGTEVRGRFRLVVVDRACGAGGGRVLTSTTVGR